ncbi:MAG: bifunctional 2-C-methyl-D-erythritol 4-phosphate cytidylyltransferase/2-C-methyl-D-erythritol 2,4-cyclodiphosphate synthase [Hyphomicrobiaceae bacterium]
MTAAALIVAAGRGTRASTDGSPVKQYAALGGKPVLAHSIERLAANPLIDRIQCVIHPDDAALYQTAVEAASRKLLLPVNGGATRQASVLAGLRALSAAPPDHVLIHDAARPLLASDVVDRIISALSEVSAAIAGQPLADTLKRASPDGRVEATVSRNGLWRAQTPQGFSFPKILAAHEKAAAAGLADFTDDAAVAEWAGMEVRMVAGSPDNLKITTAEDLAMAEALLGRAGAGLETRNGTGFDVHRLVEGDGLWLCGLKIPHTHRLEGHSDADVALHAVTDALLGAIGAGDIGQHFPPTDARWKNAASHTFLAHAAALLAQRGGRIVNVDVTILAEAPKIAPHREAMCRRVAEILGIDTVRVSVKATTTEGLGFTGRREGIAAIASTNVELRARN